MCTGFLSAWNVLPLVKADKRILSSKKQLIQGTGIPGLIITTDDWRSVAKSQQFGPCILKTIPSSLILKCPILGKELYRFIDNKVFLNQFKFDMRQQNGQLTLPAFHCQNGEGT